MEMTNKKMYVFNAETDYSIADITVIFATSFDEAVLIYSREKPKDYATQSIYSYGVFDEDQDDQKGVKTIFDDYKDMWEICKKEPTFADEYGVHNPIKRRVYSGECYGHYGFRITVTELPIDEFQVICNTEEDEIIDKVQIMKYAKERFNEIYHPDPVAEEAKRIENSMNNEESTIKDLMDKRMKYKREMFKHPSDSEEYKEAKKKVVMVSEELNRLFEKNDNALIDFKEKGNE